MARTRLLSLCLSLAAVFGQAPSLSKLHLDRARLREDQGQIDEAEAEFKAAVETAAKSSEAMKILIDSRLLKALQLCFSPFRAD